MKLIAIGACAAVLVMAGCSNDNRTSGAPADNTPAAKANAAPADRPDTAAAPRPDAAATPRPDAGAAEPDKTAGTSGPSDADRKPLTLSGCLQRGDGRNYILTELSEPSTAGAPAGIKGDGSKVEREQVNAAEHAYRLNAAKDATGDNWDQLVGKKVRVEGTLVKPSAIGTSGSTGSREKIHEGDLAQIDVTNMQKVAESCGSGGKGRQ